MLKVKPGPANRRPTVARTDSQRTEENELIGAEDAESQHGPRCLLLVEATNRQQDVVLSKTVEQNVEPDKHKLIKQADGIPQAPPLPKHLMKRTQAPTTNYSTPKGTTFYTTFLKDWRHRRVIGEGGDGIVHQYQQQKHKGISIAVKVPQSSSACEDLMREIMNMHRIGHHEHILELLFASPDWHPCGPALFLPYCELGDLIIYRESWCAHQEWMGQPERVSEITMCKLFRDMALALDYLHNKLGTRYVHNDLKPQNILAFTPTEYIGTGIPPEEPIFKLSDFARLTPWPTPNGRRPQGFDGTYEYGPPAMERVAPILPSADIWGLGTTLQYMALGICPIKTREAFIWSRKAEGKPHPDLHDKDAWQSEYWRKRIPTVYRPINVPTSALLEFYDLPHDIPDYQPFGARLGFWYSQLWRPVGPRPKGRPTASRLVREAVPNMDDQIECLKIERTMQMQHKEAVAAGKLAELE